MTSDSAKGLVSVGEYNIEKGTSFQEATTVRRTGDSVYEGDIPRDWCFGPVVHGGYLSGLLSRTVVQHLQVLNTASSNGSPQTLSSCSTTYLAPVSPGAATIKVETRSISRSSAHFIVSLYQDTTLTSSTINERSLTQKPRVEAIIFMTRESKPARTQSSEPMNPHRRIPISEIFPRHPNGHHIPHHDSGMSFYKYKPNWECYFRPTSINKEKFLNHHPQHGPSVFDVWWKFDHDITIHELGLLADLIGPVLFNYEDVRKKYWLSTRQMGVEVVRVPEPTRDGWEWLFCRMELIENAGDRFYCDVTMVDEGGDVVAIARQSCVVRPFALVGKTRKTEETGSVGQSRSKM